MQMNIYSDKRETGIPSIGVVPWGTGFCHFYQAQKDLLDILVPYFKAGLENNEYCIWVTSGPAISEDARQALKTSLPDFDSYVEKHQIEIVSHSQWHTGSRKSGGQIISRLDNAVSRGFDGLRLAVDAFSQKKGNKAFTTYPEADTIGRYNVIAVFTYPRDEFDAGGIMEIVKGYRFALVHNAGKLEVIESSEARIARDALMVTEEKLSSLFSHMSEGFAYHRIVLDSNGKPCDYVFLEVNDAFEKLTGLKVKDIIGRRVTEVLPGIEKDPTDWIGKYGKVALTGKPMRFESYAEPLNKWYSVSAFSPHKGFFAVTFTDMTDRKKFEEELLKAKMEWERTFDSVPDLVAILDDQHKIVRANKAMAERLGTTPEKCAGLFCYQVVHGLPHPPEFCPHSLTCQDFQGHVAEVYEPRLNGSFLISTTPVFDEAGKLLGSTHVARDITDLKKADDQLRLRTAELEVSNRELEAFAYSVSHDLRAPLRSMEGFSSALLEDYTDKLDDQGKKYLRYIQESSDLMGRLIDDLLNLSRVTRSDMNYEMVNLSDLARSVVGELKKTEPHRRVRLDIKSNITAYGDRNLLRLVLENLLGNAWKFSGKVDSPVIELGLVEHENGKQAYFVRDNGVGFDMTYTDKLFKPFQRLHKATEFAGTGIGLATVQRIIRRHGGGVWAESKAGEGATFYFTLS